MYWLTTSLRKKSSRTKGKLKGHHSQIYISEVQNAKKQNRFQKGIFTESCSGWGKDISWASSWVQQLCCFVFFHPMVLLFALRSLYICFEIQGATLEKTFNTVWRRNRWFGASARKILSIYSQNPLKFKSIKFHLGTFFPFEKYFLPTTVCESRRQEPLEVPMPRCVCVLGVSGRDFRLTAVQWPHFTRIEPRPATGESRRSINEVHLLSTWWSKLIKGENWWSCLTREVSALTTRAFSKHCNYFPIKISLPCSSVRKLGDQHSNYTALFKKNFRGA